MVHVEIINDMDILCRQKMFDLRSIPITARAGWTNAMLEMINFVFPISTFILSSSMWGSDSDSGDDMWHSAINVREMRGFLIKKSAY